MLHRVLGLAFSASAALFGMSFPVAAQCQWLAGDPLPGTNNAVHTVASYDFDGDGPEAEKLIIAGAFIAAGREPASHIAQWDGIEWTPLGDGLDGHVHALCVYENRLIAGGDFAHAGGQPASAIAAWDGAVWQPLGEGINGVVQTLTVYNGELIVGGDFQTAGGVPAANIVRFDGNEWHPLGSGTNGNVRALLTHQGELFVGGQFGSSGGITTLNISKWNGITWSSCGNLSGYVAALTVFQNQVVAAGAERVRSWNGTNWVVLGNIVNYVESMVVRDGVLYAGGHDTGVSGARGCVVAFDGVAWTSMNWGDSRGSGVYSLTFYNNRLTCGGKFSYAGGRVAMHVASWSGEEWEAIRSDSPQAMFPSLGPSTIYSTQEFVIFGGAFPVTGGGLSSGIVRWDGTTMSNFGSGLNAGVHAIVEFDGSVYAGGKFTATGERISARGVARWDGDAWHPVGNGLDGFEIWTKGVSDLFDFQGELVAVGAFVRSGGAVCRAAARWDGTAWQELGGGLDRRIHKGVLYKNELVVGGDFTIAGGESAMRVAAWNGSVWRALGAGLDGRVLDFAEYRGELYASGIFESSGGEPMKAVARWDGVEWRALGTGVDRSIGRAEVSRLAVVNDELIVSGWIDSAGGMPVDGVAAWNGKEWKLPSVNLPAGSGVIGYFRDEVLVGGSFISTDGIFNHHFARLVEGSAPVVDEHPADASVCRGGSASFAVVASGATPLRYQWRLDGADLFDGPGPGGVLISGATTASLTVEFAAGTLSGVIDCVVNHACGSTMSEPATLRVCDADFNCDGAANSQDLFDYLGAFFELSPAADFNRDQRVDSQDFFAYMVAFFQPCE